MLLASSRISYGMADAGHLPARFAGVHRTRGTPVPSTLAVGAGACLFALAVDIGFAAELTNFTLFLTFTVINASVILLRLRLPRLHRPFRVPGSLAGVPLLPLAGAVTSVVLLAGLDPVVLALGTVFAFLGSAWALLRIPAEPGERPVSS
jgi:APA family basic amino acid/polyamine antiporter